MAILFCNVTWLENYFGPEEDMAGGGSYVDQNESGAEVFNFADLNGKYFGYVATQGHQIRIERLGVKAFDEYIDDVLVVWVARKKIIGWYKNARVYRNYQYTIDNQIFNIEAKVSDSVLLPIRERKFEVPRARDVGTGKGMGQSNYWYADKPKAKEYIKKVNHYVNNYNREQLNNKKSTVQVLKEKGFSKGELVELKDGVRFEDLKEVHLGGWKGNIMDVFLNSKHDIYVSIKYSEDTINKMPQEYIDYKNEKIQGGEYFEIIKLEDIKKVRKKVS